MKKYCKACKKITKHLYDGDNPNRIDRGEPDVLRCTICGHRPDRPLDGEKIDTVCTECGRTVKATYVDDDGMDSLAYDCKCGNSPIIDYRDGHGYTRQQFLQDRNNAQAIATEAWNKAKPVERLECISVTVGHYTATVEG